MLGEAMAWDLLLEGPRPHKVMFPPNIPAAAVRSLALPDNHTRPMLEAPQRYPRRRPELPVARRRRAVGRTPSQINGLAGAWRCPLPGLRPLWLDFLPAIILAPSSIAAKGRQGKAGRSKAARAVAMLRPVRKFDLGGT